MCSVTIKVMRLWHFGQYYATIQYYQFVHDLRLRGHRRSRHLYIIKEEYGPKLHLCWTLRSLTTTRAFISGHDRHARLQPVDKRVCPHERHPGNMPNSNRIKHGDMPLTVTYATNMSGIRAAVVRATEIVV